MYFCILFEKLNKKGGIGACRISSKRRVMISAYSLKKLKKVLLSSFVSIMVIAGMATPLNVKAEPQKKDYSKKYKY